MNAKTRKSFPVTVSKLPTVRCQVCGATLAHRAGTAEKALTDHYLADHPEELGRK